MADNVTLNAGSGGSVIKTDDDGTAHWQYVKLAYGADNTQTRVTGSAPLPSQITDGTTAVTIDATDGSVPTHIEGRVDSNNSSTSTLGISAAFTGTGTDVSNFRNVIVNVFADQDSATNGLSIEFSSDNSNWDIAETYTISANAGEAYAIPVQAQYFRVVYTNGGTGQTAFRLQSILSPVDVTGQVTPLDASLSNADEALLTRSVVAAFDGTNYTNVQSTANGNLKVSVQEFSDGVDVGNGTVGTETLRVTLASDSTGTVAATQSGTWTLGANSGVDIGDVDVTSIAGANFTAAEAAALPSEFVVIAGDDGTDTKPINVDATSGNIQADVASALPAGDNNIGNVDIASSVALDVSAATVTVDLGTNNDVQGAAAEGAAVSGNPFLIAGDDGTNVKHIAVDTSGNVQTDVVGALPAGDNNIGNVDIVSLPSSTNTLEVVGDVAHDAAAAGNPVAVAARATNSIEGLTQVAAADASYITSDLNGCVVNRPHTTLEEILSERVSDTGGSSTNFSTFGAGGAGVHNYITTISVHNSSGTDGYVDIRDGNAGSVLFTLAAPAGGGAVTNFPIPLKSSANTAFAYDVSAALSTVYISLIGFQAQG